VSQQQDAPAPIDITLPSITAARRWIYDQHLTPLLEAAAGAWDGALDIEVNGSPYFPEWAYSMEALDVVLDLLEMAEPFRLVMRGSGGAVGIRWNGAVVRVRSRP